MPEEAKRNIFRPFAGSAREGGTGLGLSIAHDIMRAHGGDIRVERSSPEGTLFRLVLSLRQAPAAPAAKASSPSVPRHSFRLDRKSTRLKSSHYCAPRMPSSP